MPRKVTPEAYYDFLPPADHAPGDVWTGLPSHGLLKTRTVRGLVVTPACDLMNRKVETITYIPLLPIQEWFASLCFLPDVVGAINAVLDQLGKGASKPTYRLPRYPTPEDVQQLRRVAEMHPAGDHAPASKRLLAGISHIEKALRPEPVSASGSELALLFGEKKWTDDRKKLVRNALRTDTYFLPHDEQDPDWSGIPCHSLALFRYPLSAPIAILDTAADPACSNWNACVQSLELLHPMAASFKLERPIKRCRLHDRFFADLLSKYLAVYARVGAPDFTDATVTQYAEQLGGTP
ncbi:hypothetical protein [Stigmatella aurantiaca]|uniref:hypothetical protein n=1 Tax=Stigmatella aurantiaca TaxID=41 RepID=UPI0011D2712F|nr:hypothetical protein [Stigmatella aurantiaca]